jgi:outer membrane lipoprotein SlyB
MPRPWTAPFALAMLVASLGISQGALAAQAAATPKAQYSADAKAAQARYQQDLKLCAGEPDSASRMQCKRDAKGEYDKALAEAKARRDSAAKPQPAAAACADCGKVTAVNLIEKEGEGSAVGMIAGGAAGALLGRQIGEGLGKDIATLAGAAGGAYAGKQLEKKIKTHKVWNVTVSYPGSESASYEFAEDPGFKVGDTVKKSDHTIVRP